MQTPLKSEHKIAVTLLDIQRGIRCKPDRCPVARAIRRGLKTKRKISVGTHTAYIGGWDYLLPTEARAFTAAFDAGRAVHPFTFTLTLRKTGA